MFCVEQYMLRYNKYSFVVHGPKSTTVPRWNLSRSVHDF